MCNGEFNLVDIELIVFHEGFRSCLIRIDFVSFQTITPASYTKYVAREMSKAEHLLKVRKSLLHKYVGVVGHEVLL